MRNLLLTMSCCLAFAAAPALADGDPRAGAEKSANCVACHGPQGNADNPQFPRLAGQYESYLLHALRGYKSGQRKNAIMNGMVGQFSDDDLQDLAAYYANQGGQLRVVP